MSVKQEIIVVDLVRDVRDFKPSLIQCLAGRIGRGRFKHGVKIEKQDKFVLFTDANTVPFLHGFSNEWKDLITSRPLCLSTELNKPLKGILKAPVVQPCFFFFAEHHSGWLNAIEAFNKIMASSAKGYVDSAFGWATNDVDHPALDGVKGRCFALIVGWESVESHEAFWRTEDYKNAIAKLQQPQVKAEDWCHISIESVEEKLKEPDLS